MWGEAQEAQAGPYMFRHVRLGSQKLDSCWTIADRQWTTRCKLSKKWDSFRIQTISNPPDLWPVRDLAVEEMTTNFTGTKTFSAKSMQQLWNDHRNSQVVL